MPQPERTGKDRKRPRTVRLRVYRYDPNTDRQWYDLFFVTPTPGHTVLEALFGIQDRFDDSLAFRYSCRGAVCGSCAMLINKFPRLACKTQLLDLLDDDARKLLVDYPGLDAPQGWDPAKEILIEPLPHLPVCKDLVVDMEPFFSFYRAIEPYFQPEGEPPERERTMAPEAVTKLEKYTNCILCAACFGACPVNGEVPGYAGPAALAKLFRFHIDPRESGDDDRLQTMDTPAGWRGCEFHTNCARVCPKGVTPNSAIGQARAALERDEKKGEEE